MIGLDTNILVRYFTHDDPRQTPLARRLIDEQLDHRHPGHVSIVTLAELVWVLRSSYGASKGTVIVIAALDRGAGCTETLTFDRRAARIEGLRHLN